MASCMTSRFWPPLPRMRHGVQVIWIIGAHGFWVPRLVASDEWVPPWYGSRNDYKALVSLGALGTQENDLTPVPR
jgi:hypothetical protein